MEKAWNDGEPSQEIPAYQNDSKSICTTHPGSHNGAQNNKKTNTKNPHTQLDATQAFVKIFCGLTRQMQKCWEDWSPIPSGVKYFHKKEHCAKGET